MVTAFLIVFSCLLVRIHGSEVGKGRELRGVSEVQPVSAEGDVKVWFWQRGLIGFTCCCRHNAPCGDRLMIQVCGLSDGYYVSHLFLVESKACTEWLY